MYYLWLNYNYDGEKLVREVDDEFTNNNIYLLSIPVLTVQDIVNNTMWFEPQDSVNSYDTGLKSL